jgi:hypothetical protein
MKNFIASCSRTLRHAEFDTQEQAQAWVKQANEEQGLEQLETGEWVHADGRRIGLESPASFMTREEWIENVGE